MIRQMILMCMLVGWTGSVASAAGDYRGDARCPLPVDWSKYSEPYNPLEHHNEYPTFYKADWPGWSCSYQREDGVVIQYGDSRTPQQQWLDTYSGGGGDSR
jgi:hypothetical protein